jgi:hypothetical protein
MRFCGERIGGRGRFYEFRGASTYEARDGGRGCMWGGRIWMRILRDGRIKVEEFVVVGTVGLEQAVQR